MVLHYIEAHSYRRPDEFLDALQDLDEKEVFEGQIEYKKLVEQIMTA